MTAETLESVLADLTIEFALPPDEMAAIRLMAQRLREAVDHLDELPLASVEPAPLFKVVP